MNRVLLACLLAAAAHGEDDVSTSAEAVLRKNCQSCHGAAIRMSSLDLRTSEVIRNGGTRGPAVVPGDPERSLLLQVVTHQQKPHMPPGAKLSGGDIEILRRWIAAGATFSSASKPAAADASDSNARRAALEERPITAEERQFWAFRPVVRSDPPAGKTNPVDAFLAAAWRDKSLTPSPRASARTLIRRAYLDLIGLPPTPAEVEEFVQDPSDARWSALIEKLLASPHYGERWGRHWLDLVRYADSGGFERDFDWPNAWRYRDYVVHAFNSDKPYNRFVIEQIAGDELDNPTDESQIATGYLRLGLDNNIKNERTRLDELDDLVSTTSLAFLGLTVGCARCHNHKFDPIAQKDYYRMQAVFYSTKGVDYPLVSPDFVAAHKAETERVRALQKPVEEEKKNLEAPYRLQLLAEKIATLPDYVQAAWRTPPAQRTEGQRLNAAQIEKTLSVSEKDILARMDASEKVRHATLSARLKELASQLPPPYSTARVIGEASRDPLPSHFLYRGAPDMKGSEMRPGIVAVAWNGEYPFPPPPATAKSSWRRRAFAQWAASAENPLTARVMVNRIWQHHFGEGIVRTPSNFGRTGARPTHPELLDWLAGEFVRSGWSIKAMHRLMMTSDAYRMASDDIASAVAIDPENRMVWRMPRQRLPVEVIRDQMLAVAGTLDRTTGGPAVFPYIDPSLFQSSTSRTWPGKPDHDPSTWRRSLYVFTKRSIRYPMFEAFDQPDAVNSCDRRNRSTVAPQALLLMNNSSVILQAAKFAERLQAEAGAAPAAQIDLAYRLALARPADEFERTRALRFLETGQGTLADFCQLLFNLNEFAYRQ